MHPYYRIIKALRSDRTSGGEPASSAEEGAMNSNVPTTVVTAAAAGTAIAEASVSSNTCSDVSSAAPHISLLQLGAKSVIIKATIIPTIDKRYVPATTRSNEVQSALYSYQGQLTEHAQVHIPPFEDYLEK